MSESKRVERIEIFGYNDNVFYFKFFEDGGKEVIGMARTHRVYLNGEKVSPSKLKRSAKIAEFLKSLDKTLPSWAEIVPESYVNHDLETHDGQKVVNTVFAPLLWFGPDCTPPSQTAIVKPPDAVPPQKEEIAISFTSSSELVTKAIEKFSSTVQHQFLQSESSYFNIEAVVTTFEGKRMAQLEVRSAPGLVGKKVVLFQSRFFIDGVPILVMKERNLIQHLKVGQSIYCDLCLKSNEDTTFPLFNSSELFATLAWIGTKPDLALVNEYQKVSREIKRGELVGLCYNSEGCVVGGAVELNEWTGDIVRIWFDNANFFLHGTCLANVEDLSELGLHKEKVYVHVGSDPLSESDLLMIRSMAVYSEGGDWKKANFIGIGTPVSAELFFTPTEKLFEVNRDDNLGLLPYLNKRNISIDKFCSLVKGNLNLKEHIESSVASAEVTEIPKQSANRFFGRVVELRKPKIYNTPTENGTFRLENGPLIERTATFTRSNLYIFGHNMSKANLMDVIIPEDIFNVELVDEIPSGSPLVLKTAWIGPPPWKSNCKLSADRNTNLEFKTWLDNHQLSEKMFFDIYNGIVCQRPFFPIEEGQRHQAKVVSLCKLPPEGGKRSQELPRGAEYGLLQIIGEGSALEEQLVIFENNDLYIMFVHIRRGDLNYLLNLGLKVNCEIREMSGHEKKFWKRRLEFDAGGSNRLFFMPKYIATLVYVGSRPKPPLEFLPLPNEFDIVSNENLRSWLEKRKVTPAFFCNILAGHAPPKPSLLPVDPPDSKRKREVTPQPRRPEPNWSDQRQDDHWTPAYPSAPVRRQDPFLESRLPSTDVSHSRMESVPMRSRPDPQTEVLNPTASVVQETMKNAQTLLARVMDCFSPEDPKVGDIVRSPADLQLAMFISKTFATSILKYNDRNHSATRNVTPRQRHQSFDDNQPSISSALNQSSWGYPDDGPSASRQETPWRGHGGRGGQKRGSAEPPDSMFKRRHDEEFF